MADKSPSKAGSWGIKLEPELPISLLPEEEVAKAAVLFSGSNTQMSKGREESEWL